MLLSRDQLKSDQPCLNISNCTVVIEENNESESDRGKSEVKNDNLGKDIVKHVKLPEEESTTQGHYVDSIYESRGAVHSPATAPSQNEEEDVVLYVEMKYCTICHIE